MEGSLGALVSSPAFAAAATACCRCSICCGGRARCSGFATCIAAQAGDLVESALKRDAGVKDAGAMIAGHGGVLDRFDSYLFGGVAFFATLHLLGISCRYSATMRVSE